MNLGAFVEATPITLASRTPLEMVVQMFQRMVEQTLGFTSRGLPR